MNKHASCVLRVLKVSSLFLLCFTTKISLYSFPRSKWRINQKSVHTPSWGRQVLLLLLLSGGAAFCSLLVVQKPVSPGLKPTLLLKEHSFAISGSCERVSVIEGTGMPASTEIDEQARRRGRSKVKEARRITAPLLLCVYMYFCFTFSLPPELG